MNQLEAELPESKRYSSMVIGGIIPFKQILRKIENRKRLHTELRKGLTFLKEHIIQKGDATPDEHTIGTYNSLLNSINIGLRKIKKLHKDSLIGQSIELSSLIYELFTLMLMDDVFKHSNDDDKRIVLNRYLNTCVQIHNQAMMDMIWYMMINQENDLPLPDIFTINTILKNSRYQLENEELDPLQIIDYLDDYMIHNSIVADDYTYHEIIWIYGLLYEKSDKKDEIKQRLRNILHYYMQTHLTMNIRLLQRIIISFDAAGIKFTIAEMTIIVRNLKQQNEDYLIHFENFQY